MKHEALTKGIIAAAIEVHHELGAGILEKGYQLALAYELSARGHKVDCELLQSINYKGLEIPKAYRIDILVDNTVVLELKAIESIKEVHKAQLLTYLKMSGKPRGLLINFHVPLLKDGIRRIINTPPAQ